MAIPERVLVTGLSGFLGSHIGRELVARGFAIRGVFRTEAKAASFKDAFPQADVEICIVDDMTKSGAFDNILDGIESVIHAASPFTFNVENIQSELLDPAIHGTTELMTAVIKCPDIKRVVLTSSTAAVGDGSKGNRPGYTYTEVDWNPVTLEQALGDVVNGYKASKTFAEKAAWNIAARRSDLVLVTLCPPFIFGPVLPSTGISVIKGNVNQSNKQLLSVAMQNPLPPDTGTFTWADVRDVAKAHVLALDKDKVVKSERFLIANGKFTWSGVRAIKETGVLPEGACDVVQGLFSLSTKKAETQLGMEWISLERTVKDTLTSLDVDVGHTVDL